MWSNLYSKCLKLVSTTLVWFISGRCKGGARDAPPEGPILLGWGTTWGGGVLVLGILHPPLFIYFHVNYCCEYIELVRADKSNTKIKWSTMFFNFMDCRTTNTGRSKHLISFVVRQIWKGVSDTKGVSGDNSVLHNRFKEISENIPDMVKFGKCSFFVDLRRNH